MRNNRRWICIFLALAAICALLWAMTARGGCVAQIYQDGTLLREIDLTAVDAPYDFVVEDGNGGVNTVHVERGQIAVSEANCPDHTCVKQGAIGDSLRPIVCLPHRLTIAVAKEGTA